MTRRVTACEATFARTITVTIPLSSRTLSCRRCSTTTDHRPGQPLLLLLLLLRPLSLCLHRIITCVDLLLVFHNCHRRVEVSRTIPTHLASAGRRLQWSPVQQESFLLGQCLLTAFTAVLLTIAECRQYLYRRTPCEAIRWRTINTTRIITTNTDLKCEEEVEVDILHRWVFWVKRLLQAEELVVNSSAYLRQEWALAEMMLATFLPLFLVEQTRGTSLKPGSMR